MARGGEKSKNRFARLGGEGRVVESMVVAAVLHIIPEPFVV